MQLGMRSRWPQVKCKVFGSKAKGVFDAESDLDVLVELPCDVHPELRCQIIRQVFALNLRHETDMSVIIVSEEEWETDPLTILPIYAEINREGVSV
jgi:DNA polymerase sigma